MRGRGHDLALIAATLGALAVPPHEPRPYTPRPKPKTAKGARRIAKNKRARQSRRRNRR